MTDSSFPGRFAVVGNPIHHSLSPTIHSAFAAQMGRDIDYRAELVAIDSFETWVGHFFERGGLGLNVTLPFKSRAFTLADQVFAGKDGRRRQFSQAGGGWSDHRG